MYSLPYILVVVLIGLLALVYQTVSLEAHRRYALWGALGLFFFFFAFRGYVNTDWTSYYTDWEKVMPENLWDNVLTGNISWRLEPGFTLLMLLCKVLFPSYFVLNIVCTLVNLFLLMRFLRPRMENPVLGLLLFVCFGGLLLSINLMRNAISILIFVNTLDYLKERRPIPYMLWNMVGVLFHLSSLFYLPMYFVLHRKLSRRFFALIFILGNVIFLARVPIFFSIVGLFIGPQAGHLNTMLENYTTGNLAHSTVLSIGYAERLFTAVLIWGYFHRLLELRQENRIFINAYLMYASLFFFLSEFSTLSQRMAYLFFFSYWILWADLVRCFRFRGNRYLFIAFIVIYAVLKTHGTLNNNISQYDNILFGAKSYQERLYIFNRDFDEDPSI